MEIIQIAGFLGCGKTTLLLKIAGILSEDYGYRVAIVVNELGSVPVDGKVVEESGMTKNGWIPVDPATLKTSFPGVYAFGDVANVGTPKAGVFAEGAAIVAAKSIIAETKGLSQPPAYDGIGTCYIEFGEKKVGRVEVNFLSAPKPTGFFDEPSFSLAEKKADFALERYARWFGR